MLGVRSLTDSLDNQPERVSEYCRVLCCSNTKIAIRVEGTWPCDGNRGREDDGRGHGYQKGKGAEKQGRRPMT